MNFGRPEGATRPPPATREKSLATRLTTLLFFVCSFPASPQEESMARLGALRFGEEFDDLGDRLASRPSPTPQSPCGTNRPRPPCRGWPRRRGLTALRRSRRGATRSPASAPAASPRCRGSAACRPDGRRPARTAPDVGVAPPVAPDRRAERHHRAHPLRLDPRQLARVQPAEAPADDHHRLLGAALLDRALQPLQRVGPRAPVHPLPPRMDPETRLGERAAKLHRRAVVGDEAGDDQHQRPVLRPARPPVAKAAPEARQRARRLP